MTVRTAICTGLVSLLGASSLAAAATINLAPSQDVWSYQGMATTNLETGLGPTYAAILATANPSASHDAQSFIQFDLSGLAIEADDVLSATLNLYVVSGANFGLPFEDATAGSPATIAAQAITASWTANSLNWNNKPGAGAAEDTVNLTGVNQWVEFDLTQLVQNWIDGDTTNHGLLIAQQNESATVGTIFHSMTGADGFRPYLQIATVPEPASVLGASLIGLLLMRRRRKSATAS